MSKQPKHKRTKAQAAASRKWASAGRASQAAKRATEKAKGLPTRTKRQTQQSQRWAAAGRAAQARKRQGLKPLAVKRRALAGDPAMTLCAAPGPDDRAACVPVDPFNLLAGANQVYPCCAATAVACHLYAQTGIIASQGDVLSLHHEAGCPGGAYIPELLEIASSGFAGARIRRFWPLGELILPGAIAGLRLPGGSHAVLALSGAACVTWGHIAPLTGVEETWWAEWEPGA